MIVKYSNQRSWLGVMINLASLTADGFSKPYILHSQTCFRALNLFRININSEFVLGLVSPQGHLKGLGLYFISGT